MLKFSIIFISTAIIHLNVISQIDFKMISSDSFQIKVAKQVQEIKNKLHCNDIDTLEFPGMHPCDLSIDTTLFEYIPVINTYLRITSTNLEDKSNKIAPILSEVLLFNKEDKKIAGSAHIGKNGKINFAFYNYKNYKAGMPMRLENRFNYISPNDYRKVKKILTHKNTKGYFFTIDGIGGLYYISENENIELICP